MKLNMPVTTVERFLQPGKPIVTKTDLEGRITYVNESFVNISGFARDELIGQHHNVVRHPDMPAVAFADLWRTVKAGQPWRGLVKNRARNGDFYWVEAYVTPIMADGRAVGYMSVRNTPKRDEVEAAAGLYAQVNAGQAKLPATLLHIRKVPLSAQVAAGFAVIALIAAVPSLLPVARWWALSAIPACAGMAFWLHRKLVAPIADANLALARLSEGRLQVRVPTSSPGVLDGLMTGLESLRIHMRATFSDVLLSSRIVEENANRLDAQIHSLTADAEQQVERVMQVASAMEQMSVSISEISSHTRQSLATSEESQRTVSASGAQINESMARSEKIARVVDQSGHQMDMLAEAVGRIGNVTNTIREVANRTNLLALNAAIEAARAGENGRGFAVVADEVRKLAEQTAASTTDIAQTVDNIREVANATDQTMKSAANDVSESSAAIDSTRETLERILAGSDSVVEASREISEMLRQQSAASQEVASAMERISEAIDRTTHGLGNVGTASGELKGAAGELRELVRHLEASLT
jgi:aerotaxis receptor